MTHGENDVGGKIIDPFVMNGETWFASYEETNLGACSFAL